MSTFTILVVLQCNSARKIDKFERNLKNEELEDSIAPN